MKKLSELVNNEKWDEAAAVMLQRMNEENLSDEEYILGASIMEHFGYKESMYQMICSGLEKNPQNYELYFSLGCYYSEINPNQAYLSFENALYYAQKKGKIDDQEYIKQVKDDYYSINNVTVKNVSFIILSYNTLEYTQKCIRSIRSTCFNDSYEIVVVDNASDDGSAEWLREQDDVVLIENKENVGFPVGCNQGIDAANQANDILLLNSDTIMMDNSLYLLRMGAYDSDRIGTSGAVTNYASNKQIIYNSGTCIEDYYRVAQKINIPRNNAYELKSMLIMFALLIKREVYEKVGKLDERFSPGNCEDNDYGIRVLDEGYQNVLCWNCFIYHYGSKSFGKDINTYNKIIADNIAKFKNKWGFDPRYYMFSRTEIVNLICSGTEEPISVLEVGCGLGETLASIKYKYPNSDVHGIEIVERIAQIGAKKLDIVCGDIENIELNEDVKFDYIIFADVLEHLVDPSRIIHKMRSHLKEGGYILSSIPNIMNAHVIYDLLNGNFTYQDAGILDRTHLRFFTQNEIKRMFAKEGFTIEYIAGTVDPRESTENYKDFFDKIFELVGEDKKYQFDAYQFLLRAKIVGC